VPCCFLCAHTPHLRPLHAPPAGITSSELRSTTLPLHPPSWCLTSCTTELLSTWKTVDPRCKKIAYLTLNTHIPKQQGGAAAPPFGRLVRELPSRKTCRENGSLPRLEHHQCNWHTTKDPINHLHCRKYVTVAATNNCHPLLPGGGGCTPPGGVIIAHSRTSTSTMKGKRASRSPGLSVYRPIPKA